MTSVGEVAKTGNGRVLANFREIPAPAITIVEETIAKLKAAGIHGVERRAFVADCGAQDRLDPASQPANLRRRKFVRAGCRVQAGSEQGLVHVYVPQPGDDRLVEQQRLELPRATA